jgi:hypothetical protein
VLTGFLIFTGHHKLSSSERDCWSEDDDLGIQIVKDAMTHNKYLELKSALHFNDNKKDNENKGDKSLKIKLFIQVLVRNYQKWGIFQDLSVDEMLEKQTIAAHGKKWYWCLFTRTDVTVINAHLVYNRCNKNNSLSVQEFRRQTARTYLKQFRKKINKRMTNRTDITSHIQCSRYDITRNCIQSRNMTSKEDASLRNVKEKQEHTVRSVKLHCVLDVFPNITQGPKYLFWLIFWKFKWSNTCKCNLIYNK